MNLNLVISLFCGFKLVESIYMLDEQLSEPINFRNGTIVISTFQIKVICWDYNALDGLDEIDLLSLQIKSEHYMLKFIKCFNNETDHTNYQNFVLNSLLKKTFDGLDIQPTLTIDFNDFGIVNTNIFFRGVNFTQFSNIKLHNTGLNGSHIVEGINVTSLVLKNIGFIDFDHFTTSQMSYLILERSTVYNLSKTNLRKFSNLQFINFICLTYADEDVLDVSNLFSANSKLIQIDFDTSSTPLKVHEQVFSKLFKLSVIVLKNLKLEHIPKLLFRDQPKLISVNLSGNNLVFLDPNMFIANPLVQFIFIGRNMLFANISTPFNLVVGVQSTILIVDTTIDNFKSISALVQNPNVTSIEISNSNLNEFSFTDFIQIKPRSTPLNIQLGLLHFKFTLEKFREQGIHFQTSANLTKREINELNAMISIFFSKIEYGNCIFDYEMWMILLNDDSSQFNIYLKDSKVLITIYKFWLANILRQYRRQFKINCPEPCQCYHLQLLDDILIDCSNANLTLIPYIPWPSQFSKIDLIYLNLNQNLLSAVDLSGQDDRVLQHLSNIEIDQNMITHIELDAKAVRLNNITYCVRRQSYLRYQTLESNNQFYNVCSITSSEVKDLKKYVRENSMESAKFDDSTTCSQCTFTL